MRKSAQKKTSSSLSRKYDTKYVGQEPKFASMPNSEEDRRVALAESMNWYNYMNNDKEQLPYLLKFAKEKLSFSPSDLRKLKQAKPGQIPSSVFALSRMSLNGWVFNEREDLKVKESLTEYLTNFKEEEKQTISLPKSTFSAIITALDEIEDQWIMGEEPEWSISDMIKVHNPNKGELKRAFEWLQGRIEHIAAAKAGDPQAKESLRNEPARKITRRLKSLKAALEELKTQSTSPKPAKPAKTKTIHPAKLVSKMSDKLLKGENELKSVNAEKIIGAGHLYLYEPSQRKLTMLVAKDTSVGFSAKGLTITGFDEKKSKSIKLRKPEEMIKIVQKQSWAHIEKAWLKLTTKSQSTNGRVKAGMILLRADKL